MTRTTLPLQPEQRDILIGHIVQQLQSLDDRALLRLAEAAREPEVAVESIEQIVSRRRFMVALLGGGMLATTAGAVAAWQWGLDRGGALSHELDELTDELAQVWGLVDLHEQLDEIPLERSVMDGLAGVGSALAAASGAARLVRAGVQSVKDALQRLDASLAAIRANLAWLDDILDQVWARLRLLEDAIGHMLREASQISQALGAFFDTLLMALPFGIGQSAREILERIGDLVAGLPEVLQGISLNVLTLLREEWFSDEPNKGLKGWLVEPLVTRLLDPIGALMDSLAVLNTSVDRDLGQPVKAAIEQRAALRQQIVDYRARYGLRVGQSAVKRV